MGVCPKCQNPVDEGVANCPKCGQQMPSGSTGTLDVERHFDSDEGQTPGMPPDSSSESSPDKAASPEAHGTLGVPELPEELPAESHSSEESSAENAAGGTVFASSDSPETDADTDIQDTLRMGEAAEDSKGGHGTVTYGDEELEDAQQGRSGSGTAGRLKRIWLGAGGSSMNVERTLKGEDALATDSVFAQVAERVLVSDTSIDIGEKPEGSTTTQAERRQQLEQCIAAACEGSANDHADYNLTGFLGRGAMGVVLKARQKAIGRDVAIKMIQPSEGDSKSNTNAQKKKFFYEAQITGKLDHPNIVPIYELGISNSVLFYSMKQIVGTEWKDVIGQRSRDENLDILMKVADAMAFAHQRQIIHRDLKPENVMQGAFGEVLVTDWGCAVDLSRGERFSGAGSPPWMAPEMASHNVSQIGPASDIYLLGAMLYQIVAGYPPHPGQTAFECLAAAIKNVILPVDSEDPLLQIAYRAMETQPEDRYPNVEAMQEAIREYRRHAESIALTDRSEALLEQAIASKDYERFSRTLFGFQDAIELWPGNTTAVQGEGKARLAYGQAAFDKGDYDLCIQTLDTQVPAEAELHTRATKAKKEAEERENRVKALRKVLAAVILIGLGVTSVLAAIAWYQKGQAVTNLALAEKREKEAVEAKDAETAAKLLAVQREQEAVEAKELETAAKMLAQQREQEAVEAKELETAAKMLALQREQEAVEAKEAETAAKMLAEQREQEAIDAREVAQRRAAEVELGTYQSNLALSLSQVNQLDIEGANAALDNVIDPASYASLNAQGKQPAFKNWAWNRVQLLSNRELLGSALEGQVTAAAFARQANVGVIATAADGKGQLHIVRLEGKQLKRSGSPTATLAPVDSVSLSPSGDEAVFSVVAEGTDSTVYRWRLQDAEQPVAVAGAQKRSMQSLVMTRDKVVGGLNGGLWVWKRSEAHWQDSAPTKIAGVRGRLASLQLLDDNHALVLADLNQSRHVHAVNLDPQAESAAQQVLLQPGEDSDFDPDALTSVAYWNGKLMVGTRGGQLFTADMAPGASEVGPEFQEVLPQRHQTAIRSIRVDDDTGTLLTTAEEPVVQVWKPSTNQLSGWQHETYLSGTTSNVAATTFMNHASLVLGVGHQGRAIVWDIQRQQQRRQLRRVDGRGNPVEKASPVLQVVMADDNRRAVSIHEDGTLDSWDLQTGATLDQSGGPALSFIGHTPGAKFVDMAIDGNTLVTSALLPQGEVANATEQAAPEAAKRQWEFCKWELDSGKMVHRWTRPSETEQEISLAEAGRLILYASDEKTILGETHPGGQQETVVNEELGSFFGVVNPQEPNLLMLVKRSGAVRIFDTQRDEIVNRLDYGDPANGSLLSDDDVPLVGQWAPSGQRFYMVWASGRITEYQWTNGSLTRGRDLRQADLQRLGIRLEDRPAERQPRAAEGTRLTSRWQLDLKIRSQGAHDLLYMAVRFPGSEGRTRLVRVAFPHDSELAIEAAMAEELLGRRVLVLDDAETPQLNAELLARLPVLRREIAAARSVGQDTFVATTTGTVYRLPAAGKPTAYGRPATLAATGNRSADRVVTLHHGGVLWLAQRQAEAGTWEWSPLATTSPTANDIALSADGSRLLVCYRDDSEQSEVRLLDTTNGDEMVIPGAVCGSWSRDGELALVMSDGTVATRGAGADDRPQPIGRLSEEAGTQPLSIHRFTEAWNDEQHPLDHWLLVHTETSAGEAALQYFSLDNPQPGGESHWLRLGAGVSTIACSPTNGIFVTGGAGTVTVHFAAPSLNEYGKELFGLEGHAGAEIRALAFSQDGGTLITADSSNRLLGWLSHDDLQGISVASAIDAKDTIQ